MKLLPLGFCVILLGCNQIPKDKEPKLVVIPEKSTIAVEEKPNIPESALKADFIGNTDSVYAYIKNIDTTKQITLIGFEKSKLPSIPIPESIGAEMKLLKLTNFKNDVLLVNAKLKDTNFNEYYVFVYKDSVWKQPVNRFAIHKSNMSDSLVPITNDAKDSTLLLRYYSVFNMDRKSEKKFTWKLEHERIPIFNDED
ncbi:hypothetical protein [Aequorivita marisscotiae]|uniref:Lipoprotein n=1 Tax=Aequorivita marisscotiae TaxID=3040348 RepID=A0ABY8L129_9FLAO|nr:hypothetical protein [Aequorivita sp. Ant34-E75]WGF93786.1 hypothetical protein QCQ61_06260 [Aequorivita sp. Ant34-E75]